LRTALSLTRGRPLMGTVGPYLDHQRRALEQFVAGACEDDYAIAIEQGRHAEVIGELTSAVATHPLRERPRILLMTALHRNGQPADALALYQQARTLFNEELGMEPGHGLRAIHQRILSSDPRRSKPTSMEMSGR
jgi:DNA-binding SARP family transcriptional activator